MHNIQMQIIIIFFLYFISICKSFASLYEYEICNLGWKHVHHQHNETSYQRTWCIAHNGIMEYENKDYTRVDCLTDNNAVEFDFANKWAESVGQALHYQRMTGKKGKVVLILENPTKEMVYFNRVKKLADIYHFDVEYITPKILNLNTNGECSNQTCKCHKYKKK